MQHRGVEYEVVQTPSPTGWKWTFQIEGRRMKTGTAGSRAIAMAFAHAAIDKAIRVKRQPRPTKQ